MTRFQQRRRASGVLKSPYGLPKNFVVTDICPLSTPKTAEPWIRLADELEAQVLDAEDAERAGLITKGKLARERARVGRAMHQARETAVRLTNTHQRARRLRRGR